MVKLSKFLALILRHQPERFGLPLDEAGWASLSEVMEILQGLPNFRWATRTDVMRLVEEGAGDTKRRFEVDEEGKKIRARYGHTLSQDIHYELCVPPARLYHGTASEKVATIRREGLRAMARQYVHLSVDRENAARVGARHTAHPVILTVRAEKAQAAGIAFYQADDVVYLARHIPPEFLEFPDDTA
jgi:putative RNA 2'-phosphotransferase